MSQSVRRAADILTSISPEPRSVAVLAEMFGIHRSTMFRELQSLEQVGFVRRQPDGRYALGMQLAALGSAALDRLDLRTAAQPLVRKLHRLVGGTVHVGALIGDEIVYADKVDDPTGVRLYSRVGVAVRPHCSGLGKAVLAELPTERRDAVLAGCDWRRHTDTTLGDRASLDADLALTARRGWAVDNAEFEHFVNCVAVPIISSAGVVGALSLASLSAVYDLPQLEKRVPLLRETAVEISRRLG